MTNNLGACTQLHHLPARQAAIQPDGIALWWRGEAISYGSLNTRVLTLAARLASTGTPGDRVGVLAWNCPEFVELIYGVPASGKILVPLNARLAPAELIFQLQSSGVSTLFGDPDLLQALTRRADFPADITVISLREDYQRWLEMSQTEQLPQTHEEDPAWILYTSGSTGRPKGAVLTHQSFMAGLDSAAQGRPVEPDDKYFYPFPLFHIAAHNVLLQHQYGAAVVLSKSFDVADTLSACRELQVTTLSLAPTMIAMLLDDSEFSPADLSSVRTIGYGASAMPETLLQRLLEQTDVGLCQSYGMTELSGSVSFLSVADHQRAASGNPELLKSVGIPLPSVEIQLVNEQGKLCTAGQSGEILVKARQCMREYWHQSDISGQAIVDGWLHTGDIGRFNDEGYLFIVDRKKDMIISGGENIASREVEEAMRRHRSVRDCAVIGLPDPKWGEIICAVMQLESEVSDQQLSEHCRKFIASYKTPKRWARLKALPLNASGKIDKPALRRIVHDRSVSERANKS